MNPDRWKTFSLAFQLVTIAVDLSRTIHQLEAGLNDRAWRSLQRARVYARLTIEELPGRLPKDIRASLVQFCEEGENSGAVNLQAVQTMQHILEPYNMIVARERGVA